LGKRLASEGSLVDGDIDGLRQTAVRWNDVTDLERDHVTGNKARRIDFCPSTVTPYFGFGGKGIHERFDGITGITFFKEADSGVDEKEKDNADEILPIWRLTVTVG